MTIQVREKVEPEVRDKSVPEVLRHAAMVIEERGWCQGEYEEWQTARVCVMGAMGLAYGGNSAYDEWNTTGVFEEAVALLSVTLRVAYLPEWNDRPDRTAAEVTAALRAAADAYETGPVRP